MERPYGSREQVVADFGIFEDERVLDLGCGPDPNAPEIHDVRESHFPRADVLLDGGIGLVPFYRDKGLRFCVGDAGKLPFRGDAFDFVWCSHLLEHVDDPVTACKEMVRVAERGRIRTPSKLKELFRPNAEHKWMVSAINDCLVFERKQEYHFTPLYRKAVYTEGVQEWLESVSLDQQIRGKLLEVVFDWWDAFEVVVI